MNEQVDPIADKWIKSDRESWSEALRLTRSAVAASRLAEAERRATNAESIQHAEKKILLDKIEAQAAPKQAPTWCEHIRFSGGNTQAFVFGPVGNMVPDSWDQCPVAGCHAPRPK